MANAARPKRPARPSAAGAVKARHRRAFGFQTQEAQVRLIRFGGRIRIIKPRHGERKSAKRDFHEQMIAHSLFPQNYIKPVGVSYVMENGRPVWGVVSEIVKGRGRDYKDYLKWCYGPVEGHSKLERAAKRHEEFAKQCAKPFAIECLKQTGIKLNYHPANVCNIGGRPFFFEMIILGPAQLKKHIESMPPAEKAKLERLYKGSFGG